MRTLVVGDVHGCARELRKLVKKAKPDRIILVGDLFTRGPDPRGVWELIAAHEMEALLGNHDLDVLHDWKPGETLPKRAFRWLRARPCLLVEPDFLVVHAALHPKGPRRTSRKVATGVKSLSGPPWQKRWKGRLALHGHEAARGLQDRRPHTLGLDTGCVRGGRLTGYLVEEDTLVSVKAKRAYA